MSAGQVAALIAAGFFAVGMCAAVYVLLRLARLISDGHPRGQRLPGPRRRP